MLPARLALHSAPVVRARMPAYVVPLTVLPRMCCTKRTSLDTTAERKTGGLGVWLGSGAKQNVKFIPVEMGRASRVRDGEDMAAKGDAACGRQQRQLHHAYETAI